jgi:omega-amidase
VNYRLALFQMDIQFGKPEENIKKLQESLPVIVEQGCDILVLPELWTTGYDLSRLRNIVQEEGADVRQMIQQLAKTYGIHIIAGSIPFKKGETISNTLLVVNRDGEEVKHYSKLHLFQLMDEHKFLTSGDTDGLFSLDGETFAGVICYDIRFPEWIRKHVLLGAKAIFVVAEWPLPRLDHWRTLLQARAIENQCFVIACNRAGNDSANTFAGHSMIVNPWGEVIVEASEIEQCIYGTIELDDVERIRQKIPVFQDRRPEFY